MLEIVLTFHLAAALACGVLAGRSDILFGKIKNKDLIFCVFAAAVSYSVLFFLAGPEEFMGWSKIVYLKNFFANLSVSVFVSYFLWHFGLWTAGDAKLFMAFSFIVPLNFYSEGYLPLFPSSALLINIFFFSFAFVLFLAIWNFLKWLRDKERDYKFFVTLFKNKLSGVWQAAEIRRYAANLIFIFVLVRIIWPSISFFLPSIFKNAFFLFGFLFAVNYFARPVFKNRRRSFVFLAASILFLAADIIFNGSAGKLAASFYQTLIFMFVFFSVNKLVAFYTDVFDVKEVETGKISPRMVLSDPELEGAKKYLSGKLSAVRAEGLDKKQAALVRRWAENAEKEKVKVYRTMPFAPWIFAGVLLTLLLKQSVLHLLLNLLK